MDALIPILLFLALFVLVFPPVALMYAMAAQKEVERLKQRVKRLEGRIGEEVRTAYQSQAAQGLPKSTFVDLLPPLVPPIPPEPEEAALAPGSDTSEVTPDSLPWALPARAEVRPAVLSKALTPPSVKSTGASERLESMDWERFMGAKLFAWIGGLALFLGIAFFVKYAFDRELIPPWVRVALGFASGLALLTGGYVIDRRKYAITSHSLCATGVLVLYATTIACRSVYQFEFFSLIPTFLLMAIITVTAFLLAVRLDAVVVAVLGLSGGFLSPVVLPMGQDYPIGLFGYIALLNIGLMGVAIRKRWDFLIALGAVGTIATQWNWYGQHFSVPKIGLALGVFLFFAALFLAACILAKRNGRLSPWFSTSTAALSGSAFFFAAACIEIGAIATTPEVFLAAVFGPSLCLAALSLMRPDNPFFQACGAGVGFGLLARWLSNPMAGEATLFPWMLGACVAFALLHTAFPLIAARFGLISRSTRWLHASQLLGLVLVLIPVASTEGLALFTWPVILMMTALAFAASLITRTPWVAFAALVLTFVSLLIWVTSVPPGADSVREVMVIIVTFSVALSAGAYAVQRRLGQKGAEGELDVQAAWEKPFNSFTPYFAAAPAALPFGLLMIVSIRLPMSDPSPVFSVALVLVALHLGLACLTPNLALPLVGLIGVTALQYVWQGVDLARAVAGDAAMVPLLWHVGFSAAFAIFPFVAWRRIHHHSPAWIAAALSGPLHFYLVHRLVGAAYPNDWMGLVPALFAVPSLVSLGVLAKSLPAEATNRLSLLAWFGGAALFFITLIIPIQLDHEWLTIGWALEGVALLWLFHRIPHPGLRNFGLGLLALVFWRLALNPEVLIYHARGHMPIFNWYLYTYGICTACLFAAARLLRPPRDRFYDMDAPPILCSLGTVLAFLLVNIEIADFFSAEGASPLKFEFSGNFGRDMTYTIVWSLFALILVFVGLQKRLALARYAGLGLLSVALLKLFLHDLARLQALYRIGAFIGTAMIAIFASFLYQKLLSKPASAANDSEPPSVDFDDDEFRIR